jgi:GDP-L-fucose synthase
MKILVFGSNGLVGQSLKRNLSKNNEFQCYFSTRHDTDLFSFEQTQKTIIDIKPNLVINAAAKVGGIHANNTHGSSFLIENLKININILESIIPFPEIKLINLGSSCIYPVNAVNPIKEEYFMTGKLEPTNSPYALAKISGIELGKTLKKEYGHSVINLMPTNLYGPNDNFSEMSSHVIPGLIHKMHLAKEREDDIFSIWGTGTPLREFLHVDDLTKGIIFVNDNNITDDLINIGSGVEISIKELAEKIQKIVGFDGKLDFDKNMPDGNPRKLLDSSKIKSYGWCPEINLDEGLSSAYKWYKEQI